MKKLLLLFSFQTVPLILCSQVSPPPATVRLFNQLPTLETTHLILRSCRASDAQDLFEVQSDPELINPTPMELDSSVERTLYWINWRLKRQEQNQPAPWVIEHKADQKVIGLCGFYTFDEENATGNLLFTFNRSYDVKLLEEAIDASLQCGFLQMGLNRINFLINPKDSFRISLCERYTAKGLKKVGIIPSCLYYKGAYWDRILYCLLKNDFESKSRS